MPCLLFLWAAGAQADPRADAAARLTATERAGDAGVQARATALRDLAGAQAQAARVADARARQAAALRAIEARVSSAAGREAAAVAAGRVAQARLVEAERGLAVLVPVMLRVERDPVGAVLAVPGSPAAVVRGLAIVQGTAVVLARQVAVLQARRAAADAARDAAAAQGAALAQARGAQVARAAALDVAVAQAQGQVSQAEAAGRQAAAQAATVAAQAGNLRGAIAAMDAAQARQDAGARAAGPAAVQPVGRLVSPIAGPVLVAFGAAAADGPATGVTFQAARGAAVSAPCAGRVAFAAPFRSYGRLVILDCGGGRDVVLAGLGSLAMRPGQAVRAGQTVGRMEGEGARLYVELRVGDRTVDPVPFIGGR